MNDLVEALRALGRALAAPVVSVALVLGGIATAGLLAIGLAWRGAAATPFVPFQTPFVVSGGVVGLALLVFALGMFDVHVNRVLGAQRRAESDAALREVVDLLGRVPEIRRRRLSAQLDVGPRSRVKARAAQAAPARRTTGARKTAG